jgi:AcrR family transcriptional regulator
MTDEAATGGGRERGRPRSQRARRAILAATRELLEEGGLTSVTVEGIAQRAGVGKPTIYRYWGNRYEVAMTALMEAAGEPEARVRARTPLGALKRQLRQVAELFGSPLGRGVTSILASADADTEVAKAFRNHFIRARRDEGRRHLMAAVAAGDLRDDVDLELALDVIYGPLFYRLLMGHEAFRPADADAVLDMVVEGLRRAT